jgi:hypothetical protein
MAGYSGFSTQAVYNLPHPTINGKTDDATVQESGQITNMQVNTEFYVYWVNGVSPPYYVVIHRQTGTMTCGAAVVNNQNSRGWFQSQFNINPNSVNSKDDTGFHPLAEGVNQLYHAPLGTNPGIMINFSLPMTPWAQTGHGLGAVAFTATETDKII